MGFLKKKGVKLSPKVYFIDALGAMAQGLFASLLIGTILKTIGQQFGLNYLIEIGNFASSVSGAAMAASIGHALGAPALVLFSLLTVGYSANSLGGAGGPLAVYVITIFAAEAGKLVSKETKLDIIVTPIVTILVGCLLSYAIAPALGKAATSVGDAIVWATNLQPLWMGVIVSVLVGIALTLPISSAAICAALSIHGLAGGAALAGCCAQMIGFAVMSYTANGIGGFFAQGIGTSMLQMGNIVKKPIIWLPPIITSAITGPLATCLFKLEVSGVSAGMGTCGLVGPIGAYTEWINNISLGTKIGITGFDWFGLALICFVLPAILTILIANLFKQSGLIEDSDLKLDL